MTFDGIDDDYYALLNVAKNASDEEIKQAFRRLSIMYHPDKHIDPAKKQAAELIFQRLNTAHSVLFSPDLRKLYDQFGAEAVKQSWALGPYTGKDSERQRILEAIWEQEERKLRVFRSKASMSSGFDASSLFDEYSRFDGMEWSDYLPAMTSMSLEQAFETHPTADSSLELSYVVGTDNGTGSGSAKIALSRQFNPETTADILLALGSSRSLTIGASRAFDRKTMLSGRLTGYFQSGRLFPVLQSGVSRELPFGIVGSATALLGAQNVLALSASWADKTNMTSSQLTLQISPQQPLAKLKSKILISKDLSLGYKITLVPGEGSTVSFGADKAWNHLYSSGAYLQLKPDDGVYLSVSFSREDDYKFVLPIRLSSELTPSSILIGSAVPAVAGFLFERFILKPLQKYFETRQSLEVKEDLERRLEEKRTEALLIAEILRPAYEKKVLAEQQTDGLVITSAFHESHDLKEEVAIPLQMLVVDSQLLLQGGQSKSALLGFYDFAPGAPKSLTVEYSFRGQAHRAVFADSERVVIPQRSHKL